MANPGCTIKNAVKISTCNITTFYIMILSTCSISQQFKDDEKFIYQNSLGFFMLYNCAMKVFTFMFNVKDCCLAK